MAIGDIGKLKELGYNTRYLEFLQQVERAKGNAAIKKAQEALSGKKYYKVDDGDDDGDDGDNGNEKKIVNQHTEDSVYVAGYGEITNDVLEDYLEKGYIRETVVGNNIYYTAAR